MNIFAQLTEAQRNQQRRRMADAGGNIRAGGIGFANPVGLSNVYNNASLMNQLRLNTPTPRMITPPSPPPPPSPFGTQLKNVFGRVGDFVKDDRRFGDFAAGAQILSGTPLADALAVRNTINPINDLTNKSVGQVFDVFNKTTQTLTGEQVFSTDRKRMDEVSDNPNLELRKPTEGAEIGSVRQDYEAYVNPDTGQRQERLIKNSQTYFDQFDEITTHINHLETYKGDIGKDLEDVDFLIREAQQLGLFDLALTDVPFTKTSAIQNRLGRLQTRDFIQALSDMRAQSKTGGAVGQVTENEMKAIAQSKRILLASDKYLIDELVRLRRALASNVNNTIRDTRTGINRFNNLIASADPSAVVEIPAGLYTFEIPPMPEISADVDRLSGENQVINKNEVIT